MQHIFTILLSILPVLLFAQNIDIQINNFDHPSHSQIGSFITISGKIKNKGTVNLNSIPLHFNVKESKNKSEELDKQILTEEIVEGLLSVNFTYTRQGTIEPEEEVDFLISVPVSNLNFKKGKDNIIVIWPNATGNDPTPEDNVEAFRIFIDEENGNGNGGNDDDDDDDDDDDNDDD